MLLLRFQKACSAHCESDFPFSSVPQSSRAAAIEEKSSSNNPICLIRNRFQICTHNHRHLLLHLLLLFCRFHRGAPLWYINPPQYKTHDYLFVCFAFTTLNHPISNPAGKGKVCTHCNFQYYKRFPQSLARIDLIGQLQLMNHVLKT